MISEIQEDPSVFTELWWLLLPPFSTPISWVELDFRASHGALAYPGASLPCTACFRPLWGLIFSPGHYCRVGIKWTRILGSGDFCFFLLSRNYLPFLSLFLYLQLVVAFTEHNKKHYLQETIREPAEIPAPKTYALYSLSSVFLGALRRCGVMCSALLPYNSVTSSSLQSCCFW